MGSRIQCFEADFAARSDTRDEFRAIKKFLGQLSKVILGSIARQGLASQLSHIFDCQAESPAFQLFVMLNHLTGKLLVSFVLEVVLPMENRVHAIPINKIARCTSGAVPDKGCDQFRIPQQRIGQANVFAHGGIR